MKQQSNLVTISPQATASSFTHVNPAPGPVNENGSEKNDSALEDNIPVVKMTGTHLGDKSFSFSVTSVID